jgi:hypothetical protein
MIGRVSYADRLVFRRQRWLGGHASCLRLIKGGPRARVIFFRCASFCLQWYTTKWPDFDFIHALHLQGVLTSALRPAVAAGDCLATLPPFRRVSTSVEQDIASLRYDEVEQRVVPSGTFTVMESTTRPHFAFVRNACTSDCSDKVVALHAPIDWLAGKPCTEYWKQLYPWRSHGKRKHLTVF